jgi:hypothetical protein
MIEGVRVDIVSNDELEWPRPALIHAEFCVKADLVDARICEMDTDAAVEMLCAGP